MTHNSALYCNENEVRIEKKKKHIVPTFNTYTLHILDIVKAKFHVFENERMDFDLKLPNKSFKKTRIQLLSLRDIFPLAAPSNVENNEKASG